MFFFWAKKLWLLSWKMMSLCSEQHFTRIFPPQKLWFFSEVERKKSGQCSQNKVFCVHYNKLGGFCFKQKSKILFFPEFRTKNFRHEFQNCILCGRRDIFGDFLEKNPKFEVFWTLSKTFWPVFSKLFFTCLGEELEHFCRKNLFYALYFWNLSELFLGGALTTYFYVPRGTFLYQRYHLSSINFNSIHFHSFFRWKILRSHFFSKWPLNVCIHTPIHLQVLRLLTKKSAKFSLLIGNHGIKAVLLTPFMDQGFPY